MNHITTFFTQQTRRYIRIAAFAIAALMILFPPKVITTSSPFGGAAIVQDAGYTFLFTDPAAAQKSMMSGLGANADQLLQSGIEWGKLFAQLLVLGVVAGWLMRVTQNAPGSDNPTSQSI